MSMHPTVRTLTEQFARRLAELPLRVSATAGAWRPDSYGDCPEENEARVAPLRQLIEKGALSEFGQETEAICQNVLRHKSFLAAAIAKDDWHVARLLLSEAEARATDMAAFEECSHWPTMAYFELLGGFKANFNARDLHGWGILHMAALQNNEALFMAVVEKDASSLLATDADGCSAFEAWKDSGMSLMPLAVHKCLKMGLIGPNFPILGAPAYLHSLGVQAAPWAMSTQASRESVALLEALDAAGLLDLRPKGIAAPELVEESLGLLDFWTVGERLDCAQKRVLELMARHEVRALRGAIEGGAQTEGVESEAPTRQAQRL
jgi:hypothetical protein